MFMRGVRVGREPNVGVRPLATEEPVSHFRQLFEAVLDHINQSEPGAWPHAAAIST